MGIGQVMVASLLFTFALGAAGLLAQSDLRARSEVADALRAQGLATQAHTGIIDVTKVTWSSAPGGAGTLEVWTTNTGGVTFDANATEVFMDGRYVSNLTVNRTAAGKVSRVWAPGEELYMKLTGVGSPAPARTWVVTNTGTTDVKV